MIYNHPLIRLVYRNSPLFGQNALVSAYGLLQMGERFSATYRRYAAELAQSQWHSREQLLALQAERLTALILHAYNNVPYYRQVFDERKLKPADIRTPDDLYKLPLLTRQDLRRHHADLHARNIPAWQSVESESGGTTGDMVHFTLDHRQVTFDHALTLRHWAWAGYRPGDRLVVMRAFRRLFQSDAPGIHWRHDRFTQRTYLTNINLSHDNMPSYVDKLQEWQTQYLSGFPSLIVMLARYLESCGRVLPLKAVFTSSEVLPPAARKVIEQQFGCPVWDRYGTTERLAVGQQCEHGNYHQNVEFGIMQADWPRGRPAPPGTKGELILTGLSNLSMPLIRYASEDLGYLSDGQCTCGRGLPLMSPVDGRWGDVIVCADGRLLSNATFNEIYAAVPNSERVQLVQKRVGEIVMRVLPRPKFDEADAAELKRQLARLLGSGTSIRLELVDNLELTPSGKNRFVISEVDLERLTGLALRLA